MRLFIITFFATTFGKVAGGLLFVALVAIAGSEAKLAEAIFVVSGEWVLAVRIVAGLLAFGIAAIGGWYYLQWRRINAWRDRDRQELSAIACLSVGRPVGSPMNVDPQLSRHRYLKDAVSSGQLPVLNMGGATPNLMTQVSLADFVSFAATSNVKDLKWLARTWAKTHKAHAAKNPVP